MRDLILRRFRLVSLGLLLLVLAVVGYALIERDTAHVSAVTRVDDLEVQGTTLAAGNITAQADLSVTGVTTVSQFKNTVQTTTATGSQNDFVLNSTTSILMWNGAATGIQFTGFKCGAADCGAADNGRLLWVVAAGNSAGNLVTLTRDSALSTASNRIYTIDGSHNVVLAPTNSTGNAGALLFYDSTVLRWRVLSVWSTRRDENTTFVNNFVLSSPAITSDISLTSSGRIIFLAGSDGKIYTRGTAATVTACGTGPTIFATSIAGRITIGAGGTGCVVTFPMNYTTDAPSCIVTWEGAATPGTYTVNNSALTIAGATAATTFAYHCIGFN